MSVLPTIGHGNLEDPHPPILFLVPETQDPPDIQGPGPSEQAEKRPEGPPGLIRFWDALVALHHLPNGYAGLSATTGVSIRRAHGYAQDLQEQGFLIIVTGVGSKVVSERRPSVYHLSKAGQKLPASAAGSTAQERKVVVHDPYLLSPLIAVLVRGKPKTVQEILSGLAQLLDPLEDRFDRDALGYSGHLMAKASLERGHPEVKPGDWASWAGVSRRTGTSVVAKMVEQGYATKVGFGKYRCLVRAHLLNFEWEAVMEFISDSDGREHRVLLNLVECVENRDSRRRYQAILAAEKNKAQGKPKPVPQPAAEAEKVREECQWCNTQPMRCFH